MNSADTTDDIALFRHCCAEHMKRVLAIISAMDEYNSALMIRCLKPDYKRFPDAYPTFLQTVRTLTGAALDENQKLVVAAQALTPPDDYCHFMRCPDGWIYFRRVKLFGYVVSAIRIDGWHLIVGTPYVELESQVLAAYQASRSIEYEQVQKAESGWSHLWKLLGRALGIHRPYPGPRR